MLLTMLGPPAIRPLGPGREALPALGLLALLGAVFLWRRMPAGSRAVLLLNEVPPPYDYAFRIRGHARIQNGVLGDAAGYYCPYTVFAAQRLAEDHFPLGSPRFPSGRSCIPLPGREASTVELQTDEAEQVVLSARFTAPNYLVPADAWDAAGWESRMDGVPVPIGHANCLFRAVALPKGTRMVSFDYWPASLHRGAAICLGVLLVVWALEDWELGEPRRRATGGRS